MRFPRSGAAFRPSAVGTRRRVLRDLCDLGATSGGYPRARASARESAPMAALAESLLGGGQAVEGVEGDGRRLVGVPGGAEPDQLIVALG